MKLINSTLITLILIVFVLNSCQYENEEEYYLLNAVDTNNNLIFNNIGLFAYFPFEQSLVDTSANQLSFIAIGNSIYSEGLNSNFAFEFDGSTSLKLFTGYFDTLTISFWFKSTEQLKNLVNNSNPIIFNYGHGAAALQIDGTSGATTPYLSNYNQEKKLNNIINSYSEWNFIVIELIKNEKCKIYYYNKTNDNWTWTLPLTNQSYQNAILFIGSAPEGKNFFKGKIDHVRLFYKRLSEQEIQNLIKN